MTILTCYVQSFRRSRFNMQLSHSLSLIFIFFLNVLFFFSGICLNSLVILSFWRSVQLRKKLCYFMIMVLSCCDLLAVLTNHPLTALSALLLLTGKLDVYPSWVRISNIFLGFSLVALLVMNFDRYLATYYPIFHRTSVTKRKLLTLLAVLIVVELILYLMSVNDFVFPHTVFVLICFIIISPPMFFINYKLFTIARKSRRNSGIPFRMKKSFSWKNISSCLLAVVCFVVLSIPVFVYIGLSTNLKDSSTLNDGHIAAFWGKTIASVNSTFNCLIFYWKNKVLRTEGMKVIKSMKICPKSRPSLTILNKDRKQYGNEEKYNLGLKEERARTEI